MSVTILIFQGDVKSGPYLTKKKMNINGGNEIEFVKLENLESGSAYKVVFTIVLYEGTNLLLTVEVAII